MCIRPPTYLIGIALIASAIIWAGLRLGPELQRNSEVPAPVVIQTFEEKPRAQTVAAEERIPTDSSSSIAEGSEAALPAFRLWIDEWAHHPSPQLLAKGVKLAAERKTVFYDLIATDPKAALEASIDFSTRHQLPAEVTRLLETPVDGNGDLEFLAAAPGPGGPVPRRAMWRTATVNGVTYDAYVTKTRAAENTHLGIPISGVAIDDRIAIRDSATRKLAAGEPKPPGPPTTVAMENHIAEPIIGGSAPLLRRGATLIQTCCGEHAAMMLNLPEPEWPVAAWGDAGASPPSAGSSVAASSWTEGTKRMLAILVDFSDRPGAPQTSGGTVMTASHIADRINDEAHYFFDENSFGKTGLTMTTSDVTPVLRLSRTAQSYAINDDSTDMRIEATALAEAQGYLFENYDRVFLVFSDLGPGQIPGSQFTFGGLGQIGDKFMWMNGSFSLGLVTHELGHTYGLRHASRWQIPGGSSDPVDPAGTVAEYGDEFDRMGNGASGHPLHPDHYNPFFLNQLNWLPDQAISDIATGGTYRVYRFDHKNANLATSRALKIDRANGQHYWLSYRRKYDGDATRGDISDGAYLIWEDTITPGRSNLIDIDTPGTNPFDASLNVGNSFDDAAAGITFTVDAAGGSGADEYLDVTIAFDPRILLTTTRLDVDEQAGNAILTLTRTGNATGLVNVTWSTANGTATAGSDYTASSGTLTWPDGDDTDRTITVPIVGDAVQEGTETFLVNLTGITGGVIVGETSATISLAEPGSPDTEFSHEWFNYSGSADEMVIQPDGRIAMVGSSVGLGSSTVNGLARLFSDGSTDQAFIDQGPGANVRPIRTIARQADGKLVVAGNFTSLRGASINRVARLNADGSLDSNFNPGTGPNDSVNGVAIQPDGKIVIVGYFTTVNGVARDGIARLNRDGSLDTNFFTSSPAFTTAIDPETVTLQPDGKVLVGGFLYGEWNKIFDGFSNGIWRLTTDGTLDTTFDIGYGAHTSSQNNALRIVSTIAVQPDGKVIIGGQFTGFDNSPNPHIVRLNSNGSVDGSFRTSIGSGPTGDVEDILIQNDGKILLGGRFKSFNSNPIFYLARLQASGVFDGTFDAGLTEVVPDSDPSFDNSVLALALQPDGKILIGQNSYGDGQRAVARVFSALPGLAGTVEFTGGTFSDLEGNNANLTVRRVGGSFGAVSISYATIDSTATEGADYTATTGVLTWADGDSGVKTIAVPLSSDGTIEPVETFTVQLGIPIGGVSLGSQAVAQVSISDAPTTTLDPLTKSIDYQAQSYSISLTSVGSWSVTETLDWVTVDPSSSSGNASLTVTVSANPNTSSRSGNITIDGQVHALTQTGAPAFTSINPTTKMVSASAQTYEIAVTSNTSWSVSEALTWASVTPSSGTGNDSVTVTVLANPTTSSRNGTITIGGQSHDLTQQGEAPTTSINPISKTATSAAQSYTIAVTSNTSWSASESLPWASVTPTSGNGNGSISVTLAENSSTSSRAGSISIGGQTHNLTQQGAPLTTTITPPSKSVGTAAQSYDITVTSNTNWTASESLSWASLSPASGTGNDTVTVTVTENTVVAERNGTITIGGQSHQLSQQGVPPVTTLNPISKDVDQTAQSYTISVSSNTTWNVSESLAWASVSPLSGTGNDSVTVTVSENTATASRQGTITIGGQTHTLNQEAAPPSTSINPEIKTVSPAAQTYDIIVTSNTNWTVSESLSFAAANLTSGNGNTTITISVDENTSVDSRGGTITIGGQTHDLTQTGVSPILEIDPSEKQVAAEASDYTIDITSNTEWTVTESLPWLSVTPTSGSGDGTITVSVLSNPDVDTRLGSIAIGSQTHDVTQLGVPAYLNLLPSSAGVDASAQSYSVTVSSNAPWVVTESLDWVTVSPAAGNGDDTVMVTIAENLTTDARHGSVQIGSLFHEISQNGTTERVPLTPLAEAPTSASFPILWDDGLTGIYDGILRDAADGHRITGAISRLIISRPTPNSGNGGNFSATLFHEGSRAILRGTFGADGSLSASLRQRNGTFIDVELQLEGTGNLGEEILVGTIGWNGSLAIAEIPRAPYHVRLNPLPLPADDPINGVGSTFTLILPSATTTSQEPGGDGWAMMTINRGGTVLTRGALGDGTRIAEASYLSAVGTFDLFQEIYRPVTGIGRGRCGARLTIRDQAGISDFDGLFQWKKYPDPRDRRYPDGFSIESWALGSAFTPPVAGSPILGTLVAQDFNAALSLNGVDLPDSGAPITKALTWRSNDILTYYGPERIAVRVSRRTGQFAGNYIDNSSGTRLALRGVAFQRQEIAAGHFLQRASSGAARLQPGTSFPYPGSEDPGNLTRIGLPPSPATGPASNPVGNWESAAAGIYGGVLANSGSDPSGGLVNFRATPSGAFTGQLWVGRQKFNLRGTFDPDTGDGTATINRRNDAPLILNLQLARVPASLEGNGYLLTGNIDIDGVVYQIDAQRRPGSTDKNGSYTLAIRSPDGVDAAAEPAGDGYGTVVVTSGGVCRGLMMLADGTKAPLAGHLSSEDEWSIFRQLYGAVPRGFIAGKLTFRSQVGIGDLDGGIHWVREPGTPPSSIYPAGFDLVRGLVGSRYTRPVPGTRALATLSNDFHNAWIQLSGLDYSGDAALGITTIDNVLTWNAANRVIYYGPQRLVLNFNVRNGLISGRYLDVPNGITTILGGALLQEQGLVSGSARINGQSGLLSIEAR